MSTLEQRWEERTIRQQYHEARQRARDERAAAAVDPDAYWREVAGWLPGAEAEAPVEDEERAQQERSRMQHGLSGARRLLREDELARKAEREEREQQERSRARHGQRDVQRMLEEDELMRKVERGAAPPPAGGA